MSNMEFDDSLQQKNVAPLPKVIQNISTLELTGSNHSMQSSNKCEFLKSSIGDINPPTESYQKISDLKEKLINPNIISNEIHRSDIAERNYSIISAEIDFLKQSVFYLQGQIHTKSLEITSKDEKIVKLESTIEKQKRKLKDLKSRAKFQDAKLFQLESNLPKYTALLDKYKTQENCRQEISDKYMQLENLVSKIDYRRSKFTSSSPKPKNPASPYRLNSPRIKKIF